MGVQHLWLLVIYLIGSVDSQSDVPSGDPSGGPSGGESGDGLGQIISAVISSRNPDDLLPNLQNVFHRNRFDNKLSALGDRAIEALPILLHGRAPICDDYKYMECNVLPKCPNGSLTYSFYTREYPTFAYVIEDLNKVKNAPFKNKKKIIVFLCGLLCIKEVFAGEQFVGEFLKHDDYLMIYPEYQQYVQLNNCYQLNVPNIGYCISYMLKALYDAFPNLSEKNTHLVGVSLGVNVAAAIGQYFRNPKLGRISGMDPANQLAYNYPKDVAKDPLDHTAASFVDIWHTNTGVLGTFRHRGHVDIYFNDGIYQEACGESITCSHTQSYKYFVESVNSRFGFYGKSCYPDYESFLLNITKNACTNCEEAEEIRLGFTMSKKLRGFFHLQTNSKPPYAKGKTLNRPSRI